MRHAVAAIQMISSPSVPDNIATADRLVRQAAAGGAELVLLPEYWAIMGLQDVDKVAVAEPLGSGPIQDFMAGLARELGIWLIGGTFASINRPIAGATHDKELPVGKHPLQLYSLAPPLRPATSSAEYSRPQGIRAQT